MSFIIGLVLCAAALAAIILGGGNIANLLDGKALLFVVLGTAGLVFITSPMNSIPKTVHNAAGTLRKGQKPDNLIEQIMNFVQTARHSGILALEGSENSVDDPIIKKGLILITGSADRETIKSILANDAKYMTDVEKSAQEFIERIAAMTVGIGMIGTLIKIVQMLYVYKGPQTLAPGIANALLPVVYSGILAYIVLMPLASRVKSGSDRRKLQRELSIQGVLAIQSGEPPYIVEQRLSRFARAKIEKHEE
jgi:chemotaxis protein MotA